MQFLTDVIRDLWLIFAESGIWLLVGFGFAGLAHALLPMKWVRSQLGGRGAGPVFKAALLGIPLPLCSCSVIPAAATVRRHGASKGATASFAISTPETGEEAIAITWGMLGPVMAFVRPVAALVSAFIAGMLINIVEPHDDGPIDDAPTGDSCCHEKKEEPKSCCASEASKTTSCCHDKEPESACCHGGDEAKPRTLSARIGEAFRYGFLRMPEDLALWLLAGLALSAIISTAVPDAWIENTIGTGLGPMLLMLVIGLPVYVCATSSTPVAAVLVLKGLSPGAAIVFLLAGPATNMATVAWALKDLGARALALYLVSIGVVAVATGLAIDAFIDAETIRAAIPMMNGHEHMASLPVWKHIAGGLLALMLVVGGVRRVARFVK